ncbi:hypothetical protein FRC12_013501 [Ceratobasidium sp. 428]|nr:hypothetical protein FRC12_013501 [Ceratobasidium sp. 428]
MRLDAASSSRSHRRLSSSVWRFCAFPQAPLSAPAPAPVRPPNCARANHERSRQVATANKTTSSCGATFIPSVYLPRYPFQCNPNLGFSETEPPPWPGLSASVSHDT